MLTSLSWALMLVCLGMIYQYVIRTRVASTNISPNPVIKHSHVSGSDANPEELAHARVDLVKQPLDAFLVVDVEGTCEENTAFGEYPNEIIVCPRPNTLIMSHSYH